MKETVVTAGAVGGEDVLPVRVQEALGALVGAAREGLLALSVGVGLGVLAELMEEEVSEVVGPMGRHNPDRVAVRHGHEEGDQNDGSPPIPEFPQRTEECPKVAAGMTREESRNVLEEDRGRSVALHKVEEGPGEAGAGAFDHASSLPGDAEILTRESA